MRDKGIDRLRILSAYLIVLFHMSVSYVSKLDTASVSWWISDALSAISRVGVPIFVMITGSFLLDANKEIRPSILLRKYIPKTILMFLVTSSLYAFASYFGIIGEPLRLSGGELLAKIIMGHYHLWYLYMLVVLYLLTPVLRGFVNNAKKSEVFFFIMVIACFNCVVSLNKYVWHSELMSQIGVSSTFNTLTGYVGYYVSGWYIYHLRIKKNTAVRIYLLAVISYIGTVVGTAHLSNLQKSLSMAFYSNYSITVFVMSVALFLFFKRNSGLREAKLAIEAFELPKAMFLVYLIHPFFMERFSSIYALNLLPASIIVFLASTATALVLKRFLDLRKLNFTATRQDRGVR